MIRAALFKYLTTHAATQPLIATRVYPLQLPQSPKYPSIVYSMTGGPRDVTHDGPSGLVDGSFRFTVYAQTVEKLVLVKRAVVAALNGFAGVVVIDVDNSVDIQGCFMVNENDAIESPLGDAGGPLNISRDNLDFNIWYVEP